VYLHSQAPSDLEVAAGITLDRRGLCGDHLALPEARRRHAEAPVFSRSRAGLVDDLATEHCRGHFPGRAHTCELVTGLRIDAHFYRSRCALAQLSDDHHCRTPLRV